jgi:hypothetical protein
MEPLSDTLVLTPTERAYKWRYKNPENMTKYRQGIADWKRKMRQNPEYWAREQAYNRLLYQKLKAKRGIHVNESCNDNDAKPLGRESEDTLS